MPLSSVDVSVLRRVLMACPASPGQMRHDTGVLAAKDILTMRHGLQVRRIHAVAYTAQVVEFHSGGNRTMHLLIGEPMRTDLLCPRKDPELTVPSYVCRSRPEPARRCFLDLSPEAIRRRHSRPFTQRPIIYARWHKPYTTPPRRQSAIPSATIPSHSHRARTKTPRTNS